MALYKPVTLLGKEAWSICLRSARIKPNRIDLWYAWGVSGDQNGCFEDFFPLASPELSVTSSICECIPGPSLPWVHVSSFYRFPSRK